MKNLKKVLALVLVVASLMGLATMASATKSDDYSDADSITHVEAVDVMSTIGVFDGISGAFSGDSILTREQAAKIITYMILGKDDADALVASVAPYTDVSRDRWSAGSIAYCKNEGILAGVGNGRFEPDGKLTGVAFAKMCLVALGYDPNVEELTGSQWAVNTSKIAIANAKITSDLSQASLADEMSREDACQMAFNTLKADMVDYDNRGTNITVNGATITTGSTKAKPISKANGWGDSDREKNIDDDGVQQFGEKYFSKLTRTADKTDSFGRPATTWKYKANEIGTYIDSSKLIKSWTAKASKGEMREAIGGSIADKLKTTNSLDDGYKLMAYVNGGDSRTDINKDNFFEKNSTKAAGLAVTASKSDNIGVSGNGVVTELYMDDNDNVTVVMINTFLVEATDDYNTVTERVSVQAVDVDEEKEVPTHFLPAYIENEDFDVSGVKEGDYLLVTVSDIDWTDGKASLESVTPATVQTATVTEYTDNDSVTMGGTKYSYNKILGKFEKDETFAINSDATLILDTYGYIMYVADSSSSSNYVYIDAFDDAGHFGSAATADAYFTDGTHAEIAVGKVTLRDGTTVDSSKTISSWDTQSSKTGWYTYSGSSNSKYTLRAPKAERCVDPSYFVTSDSSISSMTLIKGGSVKFLSDVDTSKANDVLSGSKAKASTVKANDKTVFVIKEYNGSVSSYTGVANVPDVKLKAASGKNTDGAKVAWIEKSKKDPDNAGSYITTGYASYVFIDLSTTEGADVDGGTSVADYMFTLKATTNETHVDGMSYLKYTVVIDGKVEERWISTTLVDGSDDDNGRLFYNIKEDEKGRITKGTEVGKGSRDRQKVLELSSDKITVESGTLAIEYATSNDTAVAGIRDLSTTSKSNINLVIKGVAANDALLDDDGADYEEVLNASTRTIKNRLGGYNLTGRIYYVIDEDNNDRIETMWIYITAATKS